MLTRSASIWGTTALDEAIKAYQATTPRKCSLEVINRIHTICLVMVHKIENLEAKNMQKEKTMIEMKKQGGRMEKREGIMA